MALDLGTLTAKLKVDDGAAKTTLKGFEASANKSTAGVGGKFSRLGDIIKGVLGADIIRKFASELVDLGKQTVKNIAEFEQLSGGVEKIFDQADQAKIFEDANNAWKDLNMSANDYLNSINQVGASFAATMGDQKGYDTARQGMKAIADYASGTGRDLKMLNEKYQMITRSTSSYQSIADQFSGLLPATSKDFLAQAKAAGILSNSYSKLTDVPIEEYQRAVTEMLEKGTKDMGLYGNTAKETAHTISGSFAGMKAAFTNLSVAIGSGSKKQISKALKDVFKSVGDVAKNAAPLAVKILGGLIQALVQAVPKMIGELGDFMSKFADGIIEGGDEHAGKAAATIIKQLVIGLIKNMPKLVLGTIKLMGALVIGFVKARNKFMKEVVKFVQEFIKNFLKAHPKLAQAVNRVLEPLKKLKETFVNIINKIKDTWNGLKLKAKNAKLTVIGGAIKVLQTFKDIWETIKNGIKKVFTLTIKVPGLDLLQKAKNLWDDIIKKKAGNSNAPSKGGNTSTGGRHRNGLNFVPYDDYQASLHYGEMVLSRGEANRYRRFLQTAAPTTTQTTSPIYTNITVELDGQVVARKTAKFLRPELNTLDRHTARARGVR